MTELSVEIKKKHTTTATTKTKTLRFKRVRGFVLQEKMQYLPVLVTDLVNMITVDS